MSQPTYELRSWRPGDEPGLKTCFDRVFVPLGSKPRELAELDWILHRNPAGAKFWVATCREDGAERIVGTYGAIPNRVEWNGEHVNFLHAIDSAIDPAHRSGLKRPGLFVELAKRFYEECSKPDDHPLTYGIPTEEAWRIGKRFLAYELVRPLPVHFFPALPAGEHPSGVGAIERFDEQALWLYHRMAGHFHMAIERYDGYLNWRYVEHPRHSYHRLGVRDGDGVLRAAAVFRTDEFLGQRLCVIADWMCAPDEIEAAGALLHAVRQTAGGEGAVGVVASVPEWSNWWADFQSLGAVVHASPWFCVVRVKNKKLGTWPLRDGWWFQLGDTDNV